MGETVPRGVVPWRLKPRVLSSNIAASAPQQHTDGRSARRKRSAWFAFWGQAVQKIWLLLETWVWEMLSAWDASSTRIRMGAHVPRSTLQGICVRWGGLTEPTLCTHGFPWVPTIEFTWAKYLWGRIRLQNDQYGAMWQGNALSEEVRQVRRQTPLAHCV